MIRTPRAFAALVAAAGLAGLACLGPGAQAWADSIFDANGVGRDVLPTIGATRALGGAVAANPDPLNASLLDPTAAAHVKYVTLAMGFAHTGTRTTNFNETATSVRTTFPALAITVPVKRVGLLVGLFEERTGRVTLAEADTNDVEGVYDATYTRETSIHSVPVLAAAAVTPWLVLAGGGVFSYCDMREETAIDFRDENFEDTDDVNDTSVSGQGLLGAFALDLGRLQLGGVFRTGPDLEGTLERTNTPIGLWSTKDVTIRSKSSFRLGVGVRPFAGLALEADYDRTPWAGLKLGDRLLNDERLERWSVGIQYAGDHLWRGSKYPLNLGYHREPLCWQDRRGDKIATGKITEEIFSIGTSIPIGRDRASLGVAFEFGNRKAASQPDLKERVYTLSVSVAALEAWRREIKH